MVEDPMESYGLVISALMVLAFVLSARNGLATVEAGMTDSSLPGYLSFDYARFQGVKAARFHLAPGERVTLYYDVKIERGELVVFLRDPNQLIVWENTFREDAAETITFKPQLPGTYQLLIEGKNTRGGFDIQWNVNEE
jgi:hypothetical protein